MQEMDDLQIKKEIDEISKRIESIVQNIEHPDPNREDLEDKGE
jgi:hypothetical protein